MYNAGWRAPQPPTPHPSGERPWPFGRRGLLFYYPASQTCSDLMAGRSRTPLRRTWQERSDNAIVIRLDAPHDQIVAVHHLAPPGKSEDREDIDRGTAFDLGGVLGVISDQAATDLGSIGSTDHHRVAAGENAID